MGRAKKKDDDKMRRRAKKDDDKMRNCLMAAASALQRKWEYNIINKQAKRKDKNEM